MIIKRLFFTNIKTVPEEAVLLWNKTLPHIVTLELIVLTEEIFFLVKSQSLIIRVYIEFLSVMTAGRLIASEVMLAVDEADILENELSFNTIFVML